MSAYKASTSANVKNNPQSEEVQGDFFGRAGNVFPSFCGSGFYPFVLWTTSQCPPLSGPMRRTTPSACIRLRCLEMALRFMPSLSAICMEVICGFSVISDRMASRVFCPPFLSTLGVPFIKIDFRHRYTPSIIYSDMLFLVINANALSMLFSTDVFHNLPMSTFVTANTCNHTFLLKFFEMIFYTVLCYIPNLYSKFFTAC